MVLDNEIIAGLSRLIEGFGDHNVDQEVALIKANTPRGNFLKEDHTRQNYGQHWQPELFSRDAYETWQEKETTIESLCRQKAQEILANHQAVPLSAEVEAEIELILRRYLGSEFHLDHEEKLAIH